MRFKKTEICQTCSKVKNVCQTCLLDLEFGVPVQARDTILGVASNTAPVSEVNLEWQATLLENSLREGKTQNNSFTKISQREQLAKLQHGTPYFKRNEAHICSFFVRGT